MGSDLAEAMKIDGFDDVALCAEAAALIDVTVPFRSRQDDDGNGLCARIGFEPPQDFEAIDPGQVEIQQNDERQRFGFSFEKCAGAKQKIERFNAIPRNAHRIGDTGASERADGEFGIVRIILNQENFARFVRIRFAVRVIRREQCGDGGLESLRKFFNVGQGKVSRAALDIGDVGAMETGSTGEFLLRNTEALTPAANCGAKPIPTIRRHHKSWDIKPCFFARVQQTISDKPSFVT